MAGEGEACELFAEILHHVVALELAMHEHVEADIFLPAHRARRLVLQERFVGGVGQGALGVRGARVADVGGLRKRADGRGREGRQVEARVLNAGALGEDAGAAAHRIVDAGDARRHLRVVNSRRGLAGGGGLI